MNIYTILAEIYNNLTVWMVKFFRSIKREAIPIGTKNEKEDGQWTWGLRFLALILMWYGFRVIAEPINLILDFIPVFGSIGRLTTGFSTLIVS